MSKIQPDSDIRRRAAMLAASHGQRAQRFGETPVTAALIGMPHYARFLAGGGDDEDAVELRAALLERTAALDTLSSLEAVVEGAQRLLDFIETGS